MAHKEEIKISDKELVEHCLLFKADAQRLLYDSHVDAMYNTVYRYVQNHHDTQDILQEAFTKVFKYLKNYDPDKGNLRSWIRKIAIRKAIDFLKKTAKIKQYMADLTPFLSSTSYNIHHLETEYILSIIAELNPRDRIIFNLHEIEGYTHEEISELLDINVNSSRVYLSRIKNALKLKINKLNLQMEGL